MHACSGGSLDRRSEPVAVGLAVATAGSESATTASPQGRMRQDVPVPRREDDPTDQLFDASERLLADSRQLRGVSRQVLDHINELRDLEQRSRRVRVGSTEFVDLSREITTLSRDVFRLAVEQETAGRSIPEQSRTLEELDSLEEDDPRSPSV
jgi:hypothetical protein